MGHTMYLNLKLLFKGFNKMESKEDGVRITHEPLEDEVRITHEPLEVSDVFVRATLPSTGATSLFVGTTR